MDANKDTHYRHIMVNQGCVIRRIPIIRRILINAFFTVLIKLGRIIRLQNMLFAVFWPF